MHPVFQLAIFARCWGMNPTFSSWVHCLPDEVLLLGALTFSLAFPLAVGAAGAASAASWVVSSAADIVSSGIGGCYALIVEVIARHC